MKRTDENNMDENEATFVHVGPTALAPATHFYLSSWLAPIAISSWLAPIAITSSDAPAAPCRAVPWRQQ